MYESSVYLEDEIFFQVDLWLDSFLFRYVFLMLLDDLILLARVKKGIVNIRVCLCVEIWLIDHVATVEF